jgi:hypothetical protein
MTTFVIPKTLTYKQRHALRMKQTEPSILPNDIIMKIIRWATREKRHGKKFGETNRIIKEIAKDFRGKGWFQIPDKIREFHHNLGNPSPRFDINRAHQFCLDEFWRPDRYLCCVGYKRPHGGQVYGRPIYWDMENEPKPDLREADIIFERETPPAQFFIFSPLNSLSNHTDAEPSIKCA